MMTYFNLRTHFIFWLAIMTLLCLVSLKSLYAITEDKNLLLIPGVKDNNLRIQDKVTHLPRKLNPKEIREEVRKEMALEKQELESNGFMDLDQQEDRAVQTNNEEGTISNVQSTQEAGLQQKSAKEINAVNSQQQKKKSSNQEGDKDSSASESTSREE